MQSTNPMLEGMTKIMTEAAGAADGVRREAETLFHSQMQRFLAEQDLVPREEFEVVKDMAEKALAEVAALKEELAGLKKD
ncbi:MAG: accessory factor UbiK family protein [Pseudomonadota bacterium]